MLLIPLVCFIALFFHKICGGEAADSMGGLTLQDMLARYMFPQSQVMLCNQIGKSVFGTVYKGYAHKILPHESETLVAVKVVKGNSDDRHSHLETQKVGFYRRSSPRSGCLLNTLILH